MLLSLVQGWTAGKGGPLRPSWLLMAGLLKTRAEASRSRCQRGRAGLYVSLARTDRDGPRGRPSAGRSASRRVRGAVRRRLRCNRRLLRRAALRHLVQMTKR